MPKLLLCPGIRFVSVAGGTGIRYTGVLSFIGSDEPKCMGGNIVSFDRLLNVRHMAGDTLTSGAVLRMMRMLRNGAFQAGWILFRVASKTKSVPLCDQVGLVLIAVNL